jgi:hypothetical protein
MNILFYVTGVRYQYGEKVDRLVLPVMIRWSRNLRYLTSSLAWIPRIPESGTATTECRGWFCSRMRQRCLPRLRFMGFYKRSGISSSEPVDRRLCQAATTPGYLYWLREIPCLWHHRAWFAYRSKVSNGMRWLTASVGIANERANSLNDVVLFFAGKSFTRWPSYPNPILLVSKSVTDKSYPHRKLFQILYVCCCLSNAYSQYAEHLENAPYIPALKRRGFTALEDKF